MYDKATGLYDSVKPDDFLTEVDAHSPAIERGIGDIEGPASQAARRLAKRVKNLPPGLYAVVSSQDETRAVGPAVSDKGVHQGMRLLVSEFQIPSPSDSDRIALANYAGLMYQRAPGTEASMTRWGVGYNRGAQQILDRFMTGVRSRLAAEFAQRRSRMLGRATDIGIRLAGANWWIVRAAADEAFVLGDCPVVAALSLGHDDGWRAIFAHDSYVVVMALSPKIALLVAPRLLIPITDIEIDDQLAGITRAINRLMWRHADRYVVARDRTQLDAAWPQANDEQRRSSVHAADQIEHGEIGGRRDAMRIVADLWWRLHDQSWQRWTACRLEFGFYPWPAEDRHLVVSPDGHGAGALGDARAIGRMRRA